MQDPAPETYDFLNTAIELLDSKGEGAENLHLFILFRLTRHLGFQPTNNHAPDRIWFDLQNGYFTPTEPSHPLFLNPEKAALFVRFFHTESSSLAQLARSAKERETQLKALLDFYRLHAPGLETLHSLEVLHQTLRPRQS
jgi:DNA repair protein RecO (recombination protein O)